MIDPHWVGPEGAVLLFYGHDKFWGEERYEVLVESTVYAMGADDRYIVVKQHPRGDPSTTCYFVVERTTSAENEDAASGVWGPIRERDFERVTGHMSLPDFTITFDCLE